MTPRLQNRLLLPLLSGLLLSACDDDPAALTGCDAPHGCEVEGIDLAILEAELDFSADQPFRSQVGAHVAAPGETIDMEVRVVNRGTEAAPAARVAVVNGFSETLGSAPLPALESGEERVVEVEFEVPAMTVATELRYPVYAYLETEAAESFDDVESGNNSSYGLTEQSFHPLVPILDIDVADMPDTVRAGHPYILGATVTNLSPFVAADELSVGFCVYPGNPRCDAAPDGPLGPIGSIAAGDDRLIAVGFTPPHLEFDLFHPGGLVTVTACFASDDDWTAGFECDATSRIEIDLMPDLAAACDVPVLVAPMSFGPSDPEAACRPTGPSVGSVRYLHAFDAEAGDEFRFTPQDAVGAGTYVEFYTRYVTFLDQGPLGDGVTFTAPEDGRYYILTDNDEEGGSILFEEL